MKTKWGNARIHKTGYYVITSYKEGNHGKLLHRLIWEDINSPIPEGYHIHHIDGNKINNDLSNLKLIEISEHLSLHAIGSKSSVSKLTESQVWTIKRMLTLNYTQKHIGGVFGVDKTTINSIKKGRIWGHVKYPS
jgi:hypothetical protein